MFEKGDKLLYEINMDKSLKDKNGKSFIKRNTLLLECTFIDYQGSKSARVAIDGGKVAEKTVLRHKLRKKE